ncbi:MerR family transcriptional regulator [Pseudophaeobacter sp.]|uniref:MerR family transcriptional regulator n=1 Tax=Pseudophaeobacter sp. TaxID=1971739 RepID=UPI003298B7BD
MSKSADAFRTISEVADWLGVQAHVLRFWESKFTQIKPVKRAGGRRYYRPADMLLLGGITKLLHKDGLSIKEVQAILRDQGISHVSQLSHDLDSDGPPSDEASPDFQEKSNEIIDIPPAAEPIAEASMPPGLSSKPSTQSPEVSPPETLVTALADPVESEALEEIQTDSSSGAELDQVVNQVQEPVVENAEVSEVPQPAEITAAEPAPEPEPTPTDPVAPITPEEIPAAQPERATAPTSAAEPEQMDMLLDTPAEPSPIAEPQPEPQPEPQFESLEPETEAAAIAPLQDLADPVETTAVETVPVDADPVQPAPVESPLADPAPVETGPAETVAVEVGPVEVTPQESATQSAPTFEEENHLAATLVETSEEQAQGAEPTPEQPATTSNAAATPATVLSLLERTTSLPAHLKADVAGCAAELRAILAAG